MSDLRTAAQQALEALEAMNPYPASKEDQRAGALTALRAALAQQDEPAQEPVAWNWMLDGLPYGRACYGDPPDADLAERAATAGRTVRLLYAAPPQRKQAEPLNLRDPAVRKRLATQWGYVPAAQAEPVEPVAWKQGSLVTFNEDPYPALGGLFVQLWDGEEVAARVYANDLKTLRQRCAKVNTAPPQRKPLTEEEIMHIGMTHQSLRQVVRAVERAHGIKE